MGGLTLHRLVGEKIYVGDNIVIEIRYASRGKSKVCVTAPREVAVMRPELLTEQQREEIERNAQGRG